MHMSKQSKDMRARASRELRESRNGGSAANKADNVKRAAAYKTLAENEEWLAGEQSLGTTNARAQPDARPPEDARGRTANQDEI
jgi:hypothetical protein